MLTDDIISLLSSIKVLNKFPGYYFDRLYDFKTWDNNWVIQPYMHLVYGKDLVLDKPNIIRYAAISGFLKYVQWLYDPSYIRDISKGNITVVKWAHKHNIFKQSWSNYNCAIIRGDLETLKYLYTLNPVLELVDSMLEIAGINGKLDIIKWLSNFKPITADIVIAIVKGGNLDAVIWCNEHHPWIFNSQTIYYLFYDKINFVAINWFNDNYHYLFESRLVQFTIKNNPISNGTVEWLYSNYPNWFTADDLKYFDN